MKVLFPILVTILAFITACSDDNGVPALINPPTENRPEPQPENKAEISLEEHIRTHGLTLKINDKNLLERLNTLQGKEPAFVQNGRVAAGPLDPKIDEQGMICWFSIGNGFADDLAPYGVDADTIKVTQPFGSYIITFTLEKLIAAECTSPMTGAAALTLSDLKKILGETMTIL